MPDKRENMTMDKNLLKALLMFSIFIMFVCSCDEAPQRVAARYPYLTYLPSDYQHDEAKRWPLIIFLHGASLRGDNPEKIKKYGIPKLVREGWEFEFIIISPQCPLYKDWSSDIWFPAFFGDIRKKFRIDTNRVYLTGLSMGGEGTWYIAEQYANSFAAIAPVCGRVSHIPDIERDIEMIARIPVWIFHGAKDNVYPVEESDHMYQWLRELNPEIQYTRYPDLGHGATHDSTYKYKNLYAWFLAHERNLIE